MRISILMENRANNSGLLSEHGFSLLLEAAGTSLLFDTGASDGFLHNARLLGVDPLVADTVVLSHAHYDHAGGVPALFSRKRHGELVVGRDFFREKGKHGPEGFVALGPGWGREAALAAGWRVRIAAGVEMLTDGVHLLGGLLAPDGGYFVVKTAQGLAADDFREELSLVVRTAEGLVVLCGCAHCGITAILDAVTARFSGERIGMLLGGLHLSRLGDDALLKVAGELVGRGIPKIGLAHCSGERIHDLFPSGPFFPVRGGDCFTLQP